VSETTLIPPAFNAYLLLLLIVLVGISGRTWLCDLSLIFMVSDEAAEAEAPTS
jgi:hypothetical protein